MLLTILSDYWLVFRLLRDRPIGYRIIMEHCGPVEIEILLKNLNYNLYLILNMRYKF